MYNATKAISLMNKYDLCAHDVVDCVINRLGKMVSAVRITVDKVLTEAELDKLDKEKNVVSRNLDGKPLLTFYRYAPEIIYSYLYVIC